MALYGAPVWVHALSSQNITLLRRPKRVIAVRAIRTVACTASTHLAGDPPWDLQAEVLAQVHRYRLSTRTRGERQGLEEIGRLRTHRCDGHGCFGKYLHGITRRGGLADLPRVWRAYRQGAPYSGIMRVTGGAKTSNFIHINIHQSS
ncbi:jg22994 [Pararge aegeria aegeria]|uniref:Jg22994 protein n=1 Tax=Pararge aegeria aegeria TaxID=348720 RepID=A0A8S4QJS8_9NEOP|nr:jg22994 [Pararge aegeria aegeria]